MTSHIIRFDPGDHFVESEEVIYSKKRQVIVDQAIVASLKSKSINNARHRIRLCTHSALSDLLHEMFIVHAFGTYVRPHKHTEKSESIHVVEGRVDLILFTEEGEIGNVVQLGDYGSSHPFFFRSDTSVFHSLVIRSEYLVFHETTNGPFDRSHTVFAPWAPIDNDTAEVAEYFSELVARVGCVIAENEE